MLRTVLFQVDLLGSIGLFLRPFEFVNVQSAITEAGLEVRLPNNHWSFDRKLLTELEHTPEEFAILCEDLREMAAEKGAISVRELSLDYICAQKCMGCGKFSIGSGLKTELTLHSRWNQFEKYGICVHGHPHCCEIMEAILRDHMEDPYVTATLARRLVVPGPEFIGETYEKQYSTMISLLKRMKYRYILSSIDGEFDECNPGHHILMSEINLLETVDELEHTTIDLTWYFFSMYHVISLLMGACPQKARWRWLDGRSFDTFMNPPPTYEDSSSTLFDYQFIPYLSEKTVRPLYFLFDEDCDEAKHRAIFQHQKVTRDMKYEVCVFHSKKCKK